MKKFKEYISENYDVYLDKPDTKKFQATVVITDADGNDHSFPIGSDDNVRSAAHMVVAGLTKKMKGSRLKTVDYKKE